MVLLSNEFTNVVSGPVRTGGHTSCRRWRGLRCVCLGSTWNSRRHANAAPAIGSRSKERAGDHIFTRTYTDFQKGWVVEHLGKHRETHVPLHHFIPASSPGIGGFRHMYCHLDLRSSHPTNLTTRKPSGRLTSLDPELLGLFLGTGRKLCGVPGVALNVSSLQG